MELLDPKSIKDAKNVSLLQSYNDLIEKDIVREKRHKFIGGLPVTLERKDLLTLSSKNAAGEYNYSITQKVDGQRVFMYTGLDISPINSDPKLKTLKQRLVTFIDRENNFYRLFNSDYETLPTFDGPKMLLDGELVFFDKDGNSYPNLEISKVKSISFMAFDILYGPTEIETVGMKTSSKTIYGDARAMSGPKGGKDWNYFRRNKHILNKLILPSEYNNDDPILTTGFANISWFNIEYKPIYFMDNIKDSKIIYSNNNQGKLQKELNTYRRNFFNEVLKPFGKNAYSIKKSIKLDGLIFTPFFTEYIFESWNKLGNTQFKWKPASEQSIDFLIKRTGKKFEDFQLVNLFIMMGNKLVPFLINGKEATGLIPESIQVRNGAIAEFIYSGKYSTFVFKNFRPEKLSPNALRTAINITNVIKNPVDINYLEYFLNINSLNKNQLKLVLEYLPREKLLSCISNTRPCPLNECSLFSQVQILRLEEQMAIFKTLLPEAKTTKIYPELEIRFGYMKKHFDTDVGLRVFERALELMKNRNWRMNKYRMFDAYSDKHRTRYIFSNDFNRFISMGTIEKERKNIEDFKTHTLYNLDIRSSLSYEILVFNKVPLKTGKIKERFSFTEPNKLFIVDMTVYQAATYSDGNIKTSGNKKFQIEVEIQNGNIKTTLEFITWLISNLQ